LTTVLLIRHALTDDTDRRLSSRRPGLHLNDVGKRQAESLAQRLSVVPLAAIYASPLERTVETAEPLAAMQGLSIELRDTLTEVDFGEWTGAWMEELEQRPEWREHKLHRSSSRPPGGETMLEVQGRVVAELERIEARHPHETVAVVSHGDVIRAALLHCLSMPVDLHARLEVSPASVSILVLADEGPRLRRLNDTGTLSFTAETAEDAERGH
jgi:probable phosphomutase (TIGR03848 family)